MFKVLRRGALRICSTIVWLLILFFVTSLGVIYYSYEIEPGWVEVKHIDLKLKGLGEEFEGWKIVQISDIHINEWMTGGRLKRIVDLVNKQGGDIVVLTGDFFTSKTGYAERLRNEIVPRLPRKTRGRRLFRKIFLRLGKIESELYEGRDYEKDKETLGECLKRLKPKYKSFAVLGNHDYSTNYLLVEEALKESGIVVLKNEVYTIRKNKNYLNIAGIDDIMFGRGDLDLVLSNLPKKGTNIALVHEPDFATKVWGTHGFQLQLSGHSHGGQVRIPFKKGGFLPPYGKLYPAGLYKFGDFRLYTNRGLGMSYPLMRFNCRPEITVFTLSRER
ncbi:MAG: metallophosphoesterase [Geminocystis sp.]|nr:metallophosphoesterase [Geminocystis sp.]MCS7147974.1 metallophosphoesterase [Geminocystis sp.]MDW8116946.1 metallophosphoesterase [Geminocystis sp.]MDW8462520.1 metallophosphoesterase [Geminocystis sp.]HIK36379.1 metallophosphoesterase [Geminocystis sp. M7585_C2015_104]